ncbi:MAG: alkyl sulfatase dimerization domain-containing protein, partial [Pseudomonadales bacterium]
MTLLKPGWLIAVVSLFFNTPAIATDTPLFYRGDFDHKVVEAPNGAMVNADYRSWVEDGPFGEATLVKVRAGVWSIVGLSLSNYSFVETDNGLIAFDSGNNIGMGKQALEMIRTATDKPIIAIIYSHHHYTGGTQAYKKWGGADEFTVFAHPRLDVNMLSRSSALNAARVRRGAIQFGFYLPHEGADAVYGIKEPTYNDPALNVMGHVPVNRPVKDGEEVEFDGVRMVFHHIIADTDDSLLVHFPDHDMVMHNTMVIPFLYSLYTLRGEYYRNPETMIPYIDLLRNIRPEYIVGAHGNPITDREEGYAIATAHRDAYAFIYNQSIRAINKGMTPDEMAASIHLPKHLKEHPWLFPAYVDNEYNVRAQYRGIMGWWAEDTANLHPPSTEELGKVFIEGFGDSKKLVKAAQKAFKEKKYNLTAKLLSYVIAAEPDNSQAK